MRRPFRWTEADGPLAPAGRPAGAPDEALVERFRERYDSVIAYHAGRPADPGSYRARGVLPSTPGRLFADAREILPDVEALLPAQDLSLIDDRLAFNLDERFLLERDTFYLLYGSHFLLGLACQLRRATGFDALSLLRARGTPTLLECAVPTDHLSFHTLARLSRLRRPAPTRRTDFDFTIRRPLDPALILRQCHPVDVPDHLRGRAAV